jgi:formylmethanofuran dehydrogenase subunit E
MKDFKTLLDEAVIFHGHLCMGQVIGVRLAMTGLDALGLDPDKDYKKIIAYVEIDRCATDAISVVAHVSLGKRTLKYVDYGKIGATFVNCDTRKAIRVVIKESARDEVSIYSPKGMEEGKRMLYAYQTMPAEKLIAVQPVRVAISEFDLPGHPLREIVCERCGENIMDGREVSKYGKTICRACAGGKYYTVL